MTTPTLHSILHRATTDPAFRAQLLADPALGLTEDKLKALLANPDLAGAELSLEMLEKIAGGPRGAAAWIQSDLQDDGGNPGG